MHHQGVEHGQLAQPDAVGTSSNIIKHSMHYSDVPSTAYQGKRKCSSTLHDQHNQQYQALLGEFLGHPVHLLQDMIPMGLATLWLWESWQLLSVAPLIDDLSMLNDGVLCKCLLSCCGSFLKRTP